MDAPPALRGVAGDRAALVAVDPGIEFAVDAHARVSAGVPRSAARARRRGLGLPSGLLAADVVALALSAAAFRPGTASLLVLAGLLVVSRTTARVYRRRLTLSALDDVPRQVASALTAGGLAVAARGFLMTRPGDMRDLLLTGIGFAVLSTVLAAAVLSGGRTARRRMGWSERVLVVGAGSVGRTIVQILRDAPEFGLEPVGFVDPTGRASGEALPVPLVATDARQLGECIERLRVTTVLLAFNATPGLPAIDTIIAAHQRGASVFIVPRMYELHHDGPDVERLRGIPLVRLRPDPTLRWSWWVKRGFDTLAAATGLIALAPLLAILALGVLLDSGRPVLFWQQRIGLDGRAFRLCKFRSMRPVPVAESESHWNIAQDARLSRFGRFLRSSSLDEVPQLWNVVRGDMSLVGPRPERPHFVLRFSDEHERYWARHRVPVGLTGLAQVNGLRGDTSISDRARFDNYYIANWSLWLDVKIILRTAREVLAGHGG